MDDAKRSRPQDDFPTLADAAISKEIDANADELAKQLEEAGTTS